MEQFTFGKNWQEYSYHLTKTQLLTAEQSIAQLLKRKNLKGCSFLDIGSGSGLFSIAATKLQAKSVLGFDIDPVNQAVSIDNVKRFQYLLSSGTSSPNFLIGSILDQAFINQFSPHDIVYAWGSLHHTGSLWEAVNNTCSLVKKGGTLVLAIYNRHFTSHLWFLIKRLYNLLPPFIRPFMCFLFTPIVFFGALITTGKNPLHSNRGMRFWNDLVDWLGGYPYEYASVDEVVKHMTCLGFQLEDMIPVQGLTGCNEFVFKYIKKIS